MKTLKRHKQGFSLVEIIVAFSVIVMVILAATDLLVTIIRSNNENQNRLVAFGLAQEGLEAIRNIRDSNWLLGIDFSGYLGGSAAGKCLWPDKVCLPNAVGLKKDFAIQFNKVDPGTTSVDSDAIAGYAPWTLKDVTPSDPTGVPLDQDTRLYLSSTQDGEAHWYEPCFSACTLTPSLFSRYIEVEPLPYSTQPGIGDPTVVKKYRVSSVVRWVEQGRTPEVRLTTEITDWKGGPL